MSMQSKWTIGAMASKNASSSSPVSLADRLRQRGEVSGPEAMMTLSQSGEGRPAISSRRSVDQRIGFQSPRHGRANPSRSTANAPPAGT